jgi:hypothetical protein
VEKEHQVLTGTGSLILTPRAASRSLRIVPQGERLRGLVVILLYGALFLAWAYLRLQPTLAASPFETPDTAGYRLVSERPLGSIHFFIGIRPFTAPLLQKLAGTDERIVIGQAVLGLLCWGALALATAGAIRRPWLRVVACASILTFSLSERIMRWDFLLMSESVSLSLLALYAACWLWLLAEWRWWKVGVLLTVAFFWGFTRDTNAYILAFSGAALLMITIIRRHPPRYLSVAALLLILFLAINMTAELSWRWVFPFLNVITQRVLPETEFTAALVDQGMPTSPELLRFSGQWAYSEDYGLYNDPALASFRDWLFADGKRDYIRFLLTHPRWALTAPFTDRNAMLGLNQPPDEFPRSTSTAQQWAGVLSYPTRPEVFLAWLGAAALGTATALWYGRRTITASWYVPLSLLLFSWPLALISWHGDAMDIGRHALQAAVQARLGALILILLAADILANQFSQSRRTPLA